MTKNGCSFWPLNGRTSAHTVAAVWLSVLIMGACTELFEGVRAQGSATRGTPAQSVWSGVYADEQATRGKAAYNAHCALCHLPDLSGEGIAPPLIEDAFAQRWAEGNVGELYAVIKATMPQDNPNSLPETVYADIVAYLLKSNKYPPGQQELKPDPAVLNNMVFKRSAGHN